MSTEVTSGPGDAADGVPDVPGAVLGWRQWRLETVDGRPRLVSPVRPARWIPGRPMAAACPVGHDVPAEGCGCGLHAARMIGLAAQVAVGPADAMVIGRVALWGDVVEGERGWRATRGYPEVLIVAPGVDDDVIAALTVDYGVEVRRSPVSLEVLRWLPTAEPGRQVHALSGLVTLPDLRRSRIGALLGRHRRAADAVRRGHVDEFLAVTAELYDELRRASRSCVPREVGWVTLWLYLPAGVAGRLLEWLVDGAPAGRWPAAVSGVAIVGVIVGLAAAILAGLVLVHTVFVGRYGTGPARRLLRIVAGPFAVAALVVAVLVGSTILHDRVPPLLTPALAVVPLGMAVACLVGWRRCFPPVDRPEGVRR